jgi:hypothetical protein
MLCRRSRILNLSNDLERTGSHISLLEHLTSFSEAGGLSFRLKPGRRHTEGSVGLAWVAHRAECARTPEELGREGSP